jgi:hypothetical protein
LARFLFTALALSLAACGGGGGKLAGEACIASSECGADLLCNFAQTPSVCAPSGPPPADAAADADPTRPDAMPVPDAAPGAPDARPDATSAPDANVDAAPDATVDATPTIDAV